MALAERVVDAAVETIVEEGYYRASSNRIAARAGVTWGVIQHHFGTREGLLLAVVRRSADQLLALVRDATITGATPAERLASLVDVVWAHYSRPEFLANVQVLLNLSRDPRTSAKTVEALGELERNMAGSWQRLVDQVDPSPHEPELGVALFDIIRGVAIGEALNDAIPRRRRPPAADVKGTLVRALGPLLT